MTYQGTLLLSRGDVSSLLTLTDYIDIVEDAFRAYAEGRTIRPGLLHADVPEGEFHLKTGGLKGTDSFFCLKANAGFYRNRERFDLPNIQGLILLYSAENGYPLAVMDSLEITVNRTGAATAVAARYLARSDSRTVAICGCGTQGRIQLRALKEVLPIEEVRAFDLDREVGERFAEEMSADLDMKVTAVPTVPEATEASDVCVTCTPATSPFLKEEDVSPGTFIAAVGADSPAKQELEPSLMGSSRVVVDILEQCAAVGELHHALEAGSMEISAVHGELSELITGGKPGRDSRDQVTIFDATGTGLQDAASAAAVYERALREGRGASTDFFDGG